MTKRGMSFIMQVMKLRAKRKLVIAEMALLLASVFIFRSLWLLLDMLPAMHGGFVLFLSLLLGIAVAIPALRYTIHHS